VTLLGFGALRSGVAARRSDGAIVDLSHLGAMYEQPTLMGVLSSGAGEWDRMRAAVDSAPLADPAAASTPLLPITPGDYVDFYACEYHAARLARKFRPGQLELPPAWKYQPLGYRGCASTVVVTGSPVFRPAGWTANGFGPTEELDVEVELGLVVGAGNERGHAVPPSSALTHLFGVVLLNDWSARDIQRFESVPLGPHIGKSFCTSISPWVVPIDLLPDLDTSLSLSIDGQVVSRTHPRYLSWSPAELYAQVTVGGAATRPGDLIGTGTISGPTAGTEGSLIESGVPFLADGQTATISSDELGSVEGRVAPCPTTAP